MDKKLHSGLLSVLDKADKPHPQVINIKNVSLIAERIQLKIQKFLDE
jgi:hypothetical protein